MITRPPHRRRMKRHLATAVTRLMILRHNRQVRLERQFEPYRMDVPLISVCMGFTLTLAMGSPAALGMGVGCALTSRIVHRQLQTALPPEPDLVAWRKRYGLEQAEVLPVDHHDSPTHPWMTADTHPGRD